MKYWTTTPNVFFIAKSKESGRILGFIGYKQITAKRVEMKRLSVDPDFRGLKIGEYLVEFLIATARKNGYDSMYLTTSQAQIAAQKLYEKFGFEFLHYLSMPISAFGINFSYFCGLKRMAFLKRIK